MWGNTIFCLCLCHLCLCFAIMLMPRKAMRQRNSLEGQYLTQLCPPPRYQHCWFVPLSLLSCGRKRAHVGKMHLSSAGALASEEASHAPDNLKFIAEAITRGRGHQEASSEKVSALEEQTGSPNPPCAALMTAVSSPALWRAVQLHCLDLFVLGALPLSFPIQVCENLTLPCRNLPAGAGHMVVQRSRSEENIQQPENVMLVKSGCRVGDMILQGFNRHAGLSVSVSSLHLGRKLKALTQESSLYRELCM